MNKTFIVFKQEIVSTVMRKSFFITLFLIPLVGFLVTIIIGQAQNNPSSNLINTIFTPSSEVELFGVVDQSKLIENIPDEYQSTFTLYPNQDESKDALKQQIIVGYYIIDKDYVENGKITLVKQDYDPLGEDQNWKLENILNEMLLANYPNELNRLQNLMNFETEILSTDADRDPDNGLTFFIPYIVTMMFYIIILGSSSMMLNSITNEKTNRVMEILMTSINPTQMLTGKIVALGLVGLMQTIIWSVSGFLLLRLSGRTMDLASSFQLPISILFWGILFFIGGYTLYASLMAGLGAMVPNLKEASQATTILVIPMIIPLTFMSAIINKPNGTISLILSFFPLTAPVTMMTRLASGNVPLWQILLSLFLIFVFSYLVIRSVSNLFRAQTLLSGQEFKIKIFFQRTQRKIFNINETDMIYPLPLLAAIFLACYNHFINKTPLCVVFIRNKTKSLK